MKTEFVTVEPWADGTRADRAIPAKGEDSCVASEVAPRSDGYRCFVSSRSGTGVWDPCFADPASPGGGDLLCAAGGVWTRITGATLDRGYPNTEAPGDTRVFWVTLTNGAECVALTGAGPRPVPGYPYWTGYCSGGPYGSDSKVWRAGEDDTKGTTFPLYRTSAAGQYAAAVEVTEGKVERVVVKTARR